MAHLDTYQLLDKDLPAILMVVFMALTFIAVLLITILKRHAGSNRGGKTPLVFLEIVELYFPDIGREEHDNMEEVEVLGKRVSRRWFSILSVVLIPIIVGTSFITFWSVWLIEKSTGGNCETNFDCFPKSDGDYLQREPVANCSELECTGVVKYECYRFVFRYSEGLGAVGGILFFTSLLSKLYFAVLIMIYNEFKELSTQCYRFIMYAIALFTSALIFLTFVALSVGVPLCRELVFQTVTKQIQFGMYSLSLLVIIVAGVVIAVGIEIDHHR